MTLMTLVLILLLIVVLGGGGYMYNTGAWTGLSPIGVILIVLIVVLLLGHNGHALLR